MMLTALVTPLWKSWKGVAGKPSFSLWLRISLWKEGNLKQYFSVPGGGRTKGLELQPPPYPSQLWLGKQNWLHC